MKSFLRLFLAFSFLSGSLFAPQTTSPAQGEPDQPTVAGEIVLVAGNTIDLKWDPAQYPGWQPFVRWELYRSPDNDQNYSLIRSGYDTSVDNYRDLSVTPDTHFYYQLRVVRCAPPCPQNEITYPVFSDDATSGELWGTVYKDLSASLVDVRHTGLLKVPAGKTFTIGGGSTLVGYGYRMRAEGGNLQINGGTFLNSFTIEYGIPGDLNSTGGGWVRNAFFGANGVTTITLAGKKRSLDIASCTGLEVEVYDENSVTLKNDSFIRLSLYDKAAADAQTTRFEVAYLYDESTALFVNNRFVDLIQYGTSNATLMTNQDGEVMMYEHANAVIHNNAKLQYVFMNDDATADIQKNTIASYVQLEERSRAVIEGNTIGTQIIVFGQGAAAQIVNNTIETASPSNGGIRIFDQSTTYIANNRLRFTAFHGSESAVLLLVVGQGAVSTVYGNTLTNCKMAFFDEAQVTVSENILKGGGSAIIVGSAFGNDPVAATGSIERNTLTQGWGFELYDGSHAVSYKHNCIQGNHPGATGADTIPLPMSQRVDMTQNWWNDATGPTHHTNPPGLGDLIDSEMIDFMPFDTTPATCRIAAPPLQPDLRFKGGEAVQVVQTLDDSVPLVTDKPTLLRLYPENRSGRLENVPWEVTAYRDGSQIGQLTGMITALRVDDVNTVRANRQAGIELKLPTDWLTGTVDILAVLNPSESILETNYENNSLTKTLVFSERKKLRVGLVPINYAPPGQPAKQVNPATLAGLLDPLINMYPLVDATPVVVYKDFKWEIKMKGTDRKVEDANGRELLWQLTEALVQYNRNLPEEQKIDQIFGVFPGAKYEYITFCAALTRWSHAPGRSGGDGTASYCFVDQFSIAHEIGHNLGLRHTQIGLDPRCTSPDSESYWPAYYTDDTIQEFGYDALKDQIVAKTTSDIMSYCTPRWISPLHFRKLFEANSIPAVHALQTAQADQAYLLVGGSVTLEGDSSFKPFWQVTANTEPMNTPEGTDYCIETRDAADSLLDQRCFGLDFFGYETQLPLDWDSFLVALPYSASVHKVVLTNEGQEMGSVEASAAAPSVTVTAPNGGGAYSGTLPIAWTAQDGDSPTLYYNLFYSRDSGATWLPIVTNLSGVTSYTADMSLLPGCTTCLVRVEASDGFNLGSDVSDAAFSLEDNPPLVTIVSPEDGSTQVFPAMIRGYALDPEDGSLPGASLSWSSSLDGPLGSGSPLLASLSEGQHVLTVTVSDSAGHTSSASVTVNVVPIQQVYLPLTTR